MTTTILTRIRAHASSLPLTVPGLLFALALLSLCWPARESWIFSGIPLQTPTVAAIGLLAWCSVCGRGTICRRAWLVAAAALLCVRSADWTGVIQDVTVLFWEGQFTIERVELLPYEEMRPAPPRRTTD